MSWSECWRTRDRSRSCACASVPCARLNKGCLSPVPCPLAALSDLSFSPASSPFVTRRLPCHSSPHPPFFSHSTTRSRSHLSTKPVLPPTSHLPPAPCNVPSLLLASPSPSRSRRVPSHSVDHHYPSPSHPLFALLARDNSNSCIRPHLDLLAQTASQVPHTSRRPVDPHLTALARPPHPWRRPCNRRTAQDG